MNAMKTFDLRLPIIFIPSRAAFAAARSRQAGRQATPAHGRARRLLDFAHLGAPTFPRLPAFCRKQRLRVITATSLRR